MGWNSDSQKKFFNENKNIFVKPFFYFKKKLKFSEKLTKKLITKIFGTKNEKREHFRGKN